MTNHRFIGAKRALSLLSLSALAACGSAAASDGGAAPSDGTVPNYDTMSAKVSLNDNGTLAIDPGSSSGMVGAADAATADPFEVPAGKMPFRGVNLSGAEFGGAIPGVDGRDYGFPTPSEVDYFMGKGMTTFRVNFVWERLQAKAYGDFDATYLGKLDALVTYATSKGAHVVLNPQNFARYYGQTVGSSAVPNEVFADFWKKLSSKYAANPKVMFGLVNEPHDIGTEQWVGAANAAIAAIRGGGAPNVILAPGNGWTGAHSWAESGYGTPNSVAMLAITDPIDNTLFEVHQYLDDSSGGKTGDCSGTTVGSARMKPFVDWLRANHKRGFLGEFAGGDNATCDAAVKDMLSYMNANDDVLVGWLWWGGGPRWTPDYPFQIDPLPSGADRPPMALLAPFLAK